ncbi:Major Facilitator Superfamily protein [Flavimaricola marinus]|uniref:Major Facilitator Superfamily protein n=1 Tax=Flavimaricola marinus TaxID=1819565 RepID=A0A238LCR5_9RHOB|nr:Major Facilitator Superfamily protein [Flavimaricola marinus]
MRFLAANWAFLLAGVLLSFTSSFGQTYFISLFAGEIMEKFALTDGQWGAIYTLGTTVSAMVMIWMGGLTDTFRVRALAPVILIGLALTCLLMAWIPAAWMLVPVIFALRFFGQGMLVHLSVVAMARWFVATRGLALSISATGFGIGQAILPVIFVSLLTWVAWERLWIVAAVMVVVVLPIIAYLLRLERTPQSIAEESDVTGMNGMHWTRNQMLRHPLFWFLVPLLLGPPTWGTALFFQQVHLTRVKGWALVDFVALNPLFIVVATLATFGAGWAIDRFGTGRMIPFYLLPFAASFGVMAEAPTIPVAALGLCLFALGAGMQATVPNAFWAEYYGTRHAGSIKAAATAIMVLGTALGPGITGFLIDRGIDFPDQMWAIAFYFLFAALCAAIGIKRAGPLAATA